MIRPQEATTLVGEVWTRAALALLVWVVIAACAPARAEDQPDPYSATVKVDATADSAAAARTIARLDGQRRALNDVVQRLSGSTDLSKMPKLDDRAITDLVASFEVANEKMSDVRYLADYTFHFRRARIRQLMAAAGIAAAETTVAKPVVVIPVLRNGDKLVLWDDPNPWREAWAQTTLASAPVKLALPLGGVGDLTAIDAEQAGSGDAQALAEIAQRNSTEEALVVVATPRRQEDRIAGLDLSLKRYRSGHLIDTRTDAIEARPGESNEDILKRGVELAIADIEHGGRSAGDKEISLAATVPIHSLAEWVEVRRKLSAVPGIHAVSVVSLNRQEAKIIIKYLGSSDQLRSNLAGADIGLDGADPDWRLVPAGTAPGGQN